jgi:hypothetical protein
MRCIPTTLLLAVALGASGSCLAQQATAKAVPARPAAPAVAVEAPAEEIHAEASSAEASSVEASVADASTRSAFGKVIAIMISSLQRKTRDSTHQAVPVHTSATGTPLDIEVGDAFRSDAAPSAPPPSAAPSPARSPDPAAARPDYAVRQSALAGPG